MADTDYYWYKDAVIYELHIKAFCDGNGDGIGDFEGLLSKLDYLKDLGITAIWVLPFYPSPLKDDGYDIADYYKINPSYGDIKSFKRFLKECHERELKVITELVINHTSDQHEWFKRARTSPKNSAHRNYYVWTDNPEQYKDARIIFQDFELSNWTWDPVAGQYFWHRFFNHQPDLNFDSPDVQREIFKVIEFWCKLGVDGFRLDAVPYLFERENTNCENLPETHSFLKKLRRFVDESFPGTMLLAEANMWPEDAVAYFGNGDECHMNYNFPVMPRMFMALQMEDRYPIVEIFDQTPHIPENCQWALFLRNHDELTLEMVTDEERDYMYKVYVKDPLAKINLGIRHRLAPLMGNNRKKIELLNSLLFSFPGTPVIYYGDEIGMGDNFYLGDRDGVRTPMQWNADRNGGFSNSNPQKLYLPVIIDPQFHYELVNVEMQSQNRSSLLWWTKRIIAWRKKQLALSRGDISFVNSDNSKVLAFTRTYKNESVLVVANLSRYSQPVELLLEKFKGSSLIEMFSRNKFPVIKADTPYFLTLGPYECYWFNFTSTQTTHIEKLSEVMLESPGWSQLFRHKSLETLEQFILPAYIKNMRWFGGKARELQSLNITQRAGMEIENSMADILLIQVNYLSGEPETYQLPLMFSKGTEAEKLIQNCSQSIICRIKIGDEIGVLHDALYSTVFQQELLLKITKNYKIILNESEIRFNGKKELKKYINDNEQVKPVIHSGEQSNSSIVYNNKYFLKIYRKVENAINPDLEVTKVLSEKTGFKNIPDYQGAIEWVFADGNIVLGMLQSVVNDAMDGWKYIMDRLNNYTEKILSKIPESKSVSTLSGSLLNPLSYENVDEESKTLLDATVAERIRLLGQRTAEMHISLSSNNELKDFKPENFSLHYQRSLFFSIQSLVKRTFSNCSRNIRKMPEEIQNDAMEVMEMQDTITEMLRHTYDHKFNALKIRVHGDYHLGQILFTGKDLMILDFEGEPAATYSERRLKRSPLRDVAGMIRSLHYAAYGSLILDKNKNDDFKKLEPFVEHWYHYMSGFFMEAYLKSIGNSGLIPSDKNDVAILLQTFLIEKSVYELNYELNNRPSWVVVPLKGIKAIAKSQIHQK
jgi:maltose alpha-D-glucosyltransferase/alpha-amylase